jgi:PAS domain S-box-containing protein
VGYALAIALTIPLLQALRLPHALMVALIVPIIVMSLRRSRPRFIRTIMIILVIIGAIVNAVLFSPALISSLVTIAVLSSALVSAYILALRFADASQRALETVRQREELNRLIAELASDYGYVARVEADGHTVTEWASEAFSRITGYTLDEIARLGWDAVVYPDDRPLAAAHTAQLLAGQTTVDEYRIVRKDGQVRWLRNYGRGVWDDAHTRVVRIYGASQDVTERRQAEEALARERNLLQTVVDNLPLGVFMKDVAGRYVLSNRRHAAFRGWAPGHAIGKTVYELFPREMAERYAAADAELVASGHEAAELVIGDDVAAEYVGRLFEGRRTLVRNEVGEVTGLISTVVDITDRRRLEETLQRQQNYVRILLDELPAYAFLKDADGVYQMANSRFCRALGRAAEEVVGQTDFDLFPRELAAKYRADDRQVLESGQELLVDEEEILDGGQRVAVSTRKVPLPDAQGRIVGLIGLGVDVTARKQAEEERRQLELQLQQAQKLESLGVLAGGIAHDFNNLLVAIMGNAELALMDLTPDSPARESLSEIRKASQRAAELSGQMLAYSGRGRFVVRPVSLNELLGQMRDLLRSAVAPGMALRMEMAPELPLVVADEGQLRQVVTSLVSNAAEALGGGQGEITVRTGHQYLDRAFLAQTVLDEQLPEGEYVYLAVQDNGAGMTPEVLARIFEPFFSTKFTGRGLGLPATLGIVRGHKGTIQVISTLGAGTTVTVLLPLADPAALATPTPSLSPTVALRGSGTLLVADDEEAVRNMARLMLERSGYTVLLAADGEEALRVLREHPQIAGVLLDMSLAQAGDKGTLRALHQARPGLPVLIVSGHSEAEARERYGAAEFAGFIQKPFQLQELLQQVHDALANVVE